MNKTQTYTLHNGMRMIHLPHSSDIFYCGVVINTGSRDEEEKEQGLAHFTEHMLFKGTKKRKAWHVINRLDSIGGELNAYTTKEETFVHATVLKEDAEKAIELLADIIFNSSFQQKEIEKESKVIIDEINSYKDNPSELIFDDFEDLIFKDYAIGKNILGDKKILKKIKTKDIENFVQKNYFAANMVFFSLGALDFSKIQTWIEKHFGKQTLVQKEKQRIKPSLYTPLQTEVRKKTYQAHCVLGNRAYSFADDENKRNQLAFLNNILGGPSLNNRLSLSLREKNGLVYHIESAFYPYSDTGVWSIYFGCDPNETEKCKKLIFKELEKIKTEKISPHQLSKYKKQLKGQLAISYENKENLILNIGKSFLHHQPIDSLEDIYLKIDKIQAEEILQTAKEIFDIDSFTSLSYT